MFAVDMTKPAFNGREALAAAAAAPRRRRLFNFVLRGSEAALWGDEPITLDGKIVGWVTSAGYGHSVGAPVCMGYVTHPDVGTPGFAARPGFGVLVDGQSVPAEASLRATFDPTSARVKA
jgi:4-methylaminobutanoate oxidase (formaldehyde-forming)